MLKKDRQSKRVFIVFGPQGSGKSTQVNLLSSKYHLTIFEAGDQLRQKAKIDENLHQTIIKGRLVADDQMIKLIDEFISNNPSGNGYIFDGYPRNVEQSKGFLRLANENHWYVTVIYFNISDETAKKRLAGRFTVVNERKLYREDDQPEIVEKRLKLFKKVTLPIKSFLAKDFDLIEINAEPDEATIWKKLQQELEDPS